MYKRDFFPMSRGVTYLCVHFGFTLNGVLCSGVQCSSFGTIQRFICSIHECRTFHRLTLNKCSLTYYSVRIFSFPIEGISRLPKAQDNARGEEKKTQRENKSK